MNRPFVFVALLLLCSIASAESVYMLDIIIYQNDNVELRSFDIISGSPGPFSDAGGNNNYEFRILSKDKEVLFDQSFHLGYAAYRFRGPNSTSPDIVPYDKTENYWRLPYFDDAALIQLFHEGKIIFEYDVSKRQQTFPSNLNSIILIVGAIAIAVLILILFKRFSRPAKTGGKA